MKKADSLQNADNTTHADDLAAAGEALIEAQDDPNSHTLDVPIVRGNQTIDRIALRRPKAGELRGTSLSDLVNLDVGALSRVLPRISSPTLTEQDVANLDPADLVMLGGIFVGFLMTKAVASKMASLNA